MFYSNKDASVLCQGAEAYRRMKGPLSTTQVSRFLQIGRGRWEAAGADVRQVALMLRLIGVHAEHHQALTHPHFHVFLERLCPSLLQVRCRG